MPAHITLLYPFAQPSIAEGSVGTLDELFAAVRAFDFSLVEVRRFPMTAYLHPEPPAAFARLTEMLARSWPEFLPYRGMFSTLVPHLTVADRATPEVVDAVDAAVGHRLPIRCRAAEAWLMCSDDQGIWSRRGIFRFRG